MGDNASNPHHKSKAKGDISYSANMAMWWLGRSGAGRYIVTRERLRSPCSEPLPHGRALGTTYREWLSIVAGPAWCSHILPLRVCICWGFGEKGWQGHWINLRKKIAAAPQLPWVTDLCAGQGSITEDGRTQIWVLRRKWPGGEGIRRMSSLFALAHFFFNTSVALTFLKECF